jgi:alpha-beta hydrolase superfamily lysophospholipase
VTVIAPGRHQQDTFVASDGVSLFGQSWEPAGIKGRIALIHGFGEHSSRYAHVAERLNAEGYAVYTYDQRGHGNSPGKKGHIADFDRLIDDAREFIERTLSQSADGPGFVFGHSMGGLVVTAWALRFPSEVRGLILTSPAVKADENTSAIVRKMAKWLARIAPNLKAHEFSPSDISRIEGVVRAYATDPLVHHGFINARTGYEMMKTIDYVEANLARLRLPFTTMHGKADRIVSYHAAEMLYERAGSKDKSIHVYEGAYHELFNDLTADRFFADLLDWLKART